MGDVTKGAIGKQDLEGWDGTSTKTFTRETSEDYNATLNAIDWPGCDVLKEYGGNVNRTKASIASALAAIGAVNVTPLWFSPGTWTIDDDITITSNIVMIVPAGCVFAISAGKVMTVQGIIIAGPYAIVSGTGYLTYDFNGLGGGFPEWFSADAVDNSNNATSGIGEDDLASVDVPAGFMGLYGGLKVFAAGTKSGVAGDKIVKFHFGSTEFQIARSNNQADWMLEVQVWNTAAAAQRIAWKYYEGDLVVLSGYETATEDTTSDVTMKLTGECKDGADSVTQTMFHWKRI